MKKWAIWTVLALALVGLSFGAASAAAMKTITITEGRVLPKTANVEKGTTVVWLNNTNSQVNIFFSKGKEVEAVCASPTRFALDSEGKYNSGALPVGGTASVCFIEAGKYGYTVTGFSQTGNKIDGTIVVK